MQCSEQREGYTLTCIGLKALVLHTTMINHRSKITKKRIVSFVNSEASPKENQGLQGYGFLISQRHMLNIQKGQEKYTLKKHKSINMVIQL